MRIIRTLLTSAVAAAVCIAAPLQSAGTRDRSVAYNWYCRHMNNGSVPPIAPEMSFIEDYDGYCIDRSSSDVNKKIYLTFDAGYENGNIEKILDVLKEKDVRAGFFILENLVNRNPDLVMRMANEGHLVCNHTANHKDMTEIHSEEEFRIELEALNSAVKENTGVQVAKYYRPPEGRFTENNLVWAKDLGYKTIFWSFAYADWDNERQPDPERSVDMIIKCAHPGEILLLHPTSEVNAKILPEIIDRLSGMGYSFASLDELPENPKS